jgi:hypothetical protein
MNQNLVSRFASAGLDLRLAMAPFAANTADIFQLDIRRARAHDARSEHFLAWTGAQENLVAVQGIDPRERQLVLVVNERQTAFEESIPRWIVKSAPGVVGSEEWRKAIASRIGGVTPSSIVARAGGASILRTTRGATRHMLVGRDERQLFMCELPRGCSTVRAAHDALRAPAARSRSKSALDLPIRQGEWFFVVVTGAESSELEKEISGNRVIVFRKRSINSVIPRSGKPHVADELAVLLTAGATPRVYARGAVRHLDHKTIHLNRWRRVVRNLEVDQARSPLGGTWID